MPAKSKCLDRPKETCKAPCKWKDDACHPPVRRAVSPQTKATLSTAAKDRAAQNPWLAHVANVRAQNPSLSYRDTLVKAKQTYTKVSPKVKVTKSPKGPKSPRGMAISQGRDRAKVGRLQSSQREALQRAFSQTLKQEPKRVSKSYKSPRGVAISQGRERAKFGREQSVQRQALQKAFRELNQSGRATLETMVSKYLDNVENEYFRETIHEVMVENSLNLNDYTFKKFVSLVKERLVNASNRSYELEAELFLEVLTEMVDFETFEEIKKIEFRKIGKEIRKQLIDREQLLEELRFLWENKEDYA